MNALIKDARLALETIEHCAHRPESRQHAISSAEWLEQIARQIREMLLAEPTPPAAETSTPSMEVAP